MLTVQYDPSWTTAFSKICRRLELHLPKGFEVEHVGSTSVPGMRAKPIVDIDVICPVGSMNRAIGSLANADYEHKGDQGIPSREAFDYIGSSPLPEHHLYVCETASPELHRHLAFRDFLRAHPEWRERLSELKRQLSFEPGMTRDSYQERKSPVVIEILELALSRNRSTVAATGE